MLKKPIRERGELLAFTCKCFYCERGLCYDDLPKAKFFLPEELTAVEHPTVSLHVKRVSCYSSYKVILEFLKMGQDTFSTRFKDQKQTSDFYDSCKVLELYINLIGTKMTLLDESKEDLEDVLL